MSRLPQLHEFACRLTKALRQIYEELERRTEDAVAANVFPGWSPLQIARAISEAIVSWWMQPSTIPI